MFGSRSRGALNKTLRHASLDELSSKSSKEKANATTQFGVQERFDDQQGAFHGIEDLVDDYGGADDVGNAFDMPVDQVVDTENSDISAEFEDESVSDVSDDQESGSFLPDDDNGKLFAKPGFADLGVPSKLPNGMTLEDAVATLKGVSTYALPPAKVCRKLALVCWFSIALFMIDQLRRRSSPRTVMIPSVRAVHSPNGIWRKSCKLRSRNLRLDQLRRMLCCPRSTRS